MIDEGMAAVVNDRKRFPADDWRLGQLFKLELIAIALMIETYLLVPHSSRDSHSMPKHRKFNS